MMEKPWKNSKEYYDLQAVDIYSNPDTNFYHRGFIGNNDEEFIDYLIQESGVDSNSKVLDMGCGSGYFVNELSKFCKSKGITNSPVNLKYCQSTYPNSSYELANMETYKTNNITHCFALESFNYTHYKTTFKNVYNMLTDNGIFFLKEWNGLEVENNKAKQNRIYWEKFWCYKAPKTSKIISIAEECGFKLISNESLEGKFNKYLYKGTFQYHHDYVKNFSVPYPGEKYTIPVQLKFQKI